MKVIHIASEVSPWSQTGGLADVVGSLPEALVQIGKGTLKAATFSPFYPSVAKAAALRGAHICEAIENLEISLHSVPHKVRILYLDRSTTAQHFFVDYPPYFDREGIYGPEAGGSYSDNDLRFALLCKAAISALPIVSDPIPEVIHAHDWQAALALFYAQFQSYSSIPTRILTIHNLAYQGVFDRSALERLDIPASDMTLERFEFHQKVNLLKGGASYANAITTVSRRYAEEILTPEFGCGLHGFLTAHKQRLHGIINGIDLFRWNPATDFDISTTYDSTTIKRKADCRRALLDETGLGAADDELVLGIVSRLDNQKGLDIVADIAAELDEMGAKLVILGTGDPWLRDRFVQLAQEHPGIAMRAAFDVRFARRIYAGADALLMPSRFEPCGLNQLYAMRYGTIPIVHPVGGLRDTVHDLAANNSEAHSPTGIYIPSLTREGLKASIENAVQIFRKDRDTWDEMVQTGMRRDSSWQASARKYLSLYSSCIEKDRRA